MAPKFLEKMTPEVWVCVLTTLMMVAAIAGMVYVSQVNSRNMENCPELCALPAAPSGVDVSTRSEKGSASTTPIVSNEEKTEPESRVTQVSVPPFSTGKLGENTNFYF